MKLLDLELRNIKSYVQEKINFQDGINCILGLNGSGKSTIIESIGFVLFNFSSRTSSKMLRYNCKQGSIALRFIANDGIIYRIERNFKAKASGSVKIIDEEKRTILFDNVSDVYGFVKKALEIPYSKELPKLFEEIIAVPQGKYVNAFLETASVRKENFDRLFELHIYKKMSERMKEISSYINKEKINLLNNSIANKNGKLENLPEEEEKYQKIQNELEKQQVLKKELEEELKAIEFEIKEIKKIKEKLNHKNEEYNLNNSHLEHLTKQLLDLQFQLNEANQAYENVEKTKFAYIRYCQNVEQIEKENQNIKVFDETNEKIHELKQSFVRLEEEIKSFQTSISHYKSDIAIAEEDIKNKNKTLNEYQNKIVEKQKSLNPILEQINNLEQAKKDKKEKNDKASMNLSNIQFSLNTLEILPNAQLEEKKNQFSIILDKEKKLEEAKKEYENITLKIQELQSNLIHLQENIKFIENGKCPLLQETCHNVKEGNLIDKLSKRVDDINIEIDSLRQKSHEYEQIISEEKQILNDKFSLKNIIQTSEDARNKLMDKEIEFSNNFSFLEFKSNNLDDKIQFVNDWIKKSAEEIQEIENNIKSLNNEKEEIKNDLITIQLQFKNIEEVIKREKDNIDKNQKEIINADLTITKKENEKNKLNNDIELLNKQLDNLKDAKKNIEELTESNKKLEDQYQKYLKNQETAKKKDELEKKVQELIQQKLELENKMQLLQDELTSLNNSYSSDNETKADETHSKIINNIGQNSSSIQGFQDSLNETKSKLDNLYKIKQEKEKEENELNIYIKRSEFLDKVRKIMDILPKELSKQYREYISSASSILYHKISNENVRIDMAEDYEISLIDDTNESQRKTMDQLSGGEQMSIAISVRLAMLKQLTGLDIYFLDEPTINLDYERRRRIEEVIREVSNQLKQLYVISHDDTFDNITDSIIHVVKENLESKIFN